MVVKCAFLCLWKRVYLVLCYYFAMYFTNSPIGATYEKFTC